ncbi:MAG: hypothetical protein ACHQ4H_13320 [Ktedonobacterales bacterium]
MRQPIFRRPRRLVLLLAPLALAGIVASFLAGQAAGHPFGSLVALGGLGGTLGAPANGQVHGSLGGRNPGATTAAPQNTTPIHHAVASTAGTAAARPHALVQSARPRPHAMPAASRGHAHAHHHDKPKGTPDGHGEGNGHANGHGHGNGHARAAPGSGYRD